MNLVYENTRGLNMLMNFSYCISKTFWKKCSILLRFKNYIHIAEIAIFVKKNNIIGFHVSNSKYVLRII